MHGPVLLLRRHDFEGLDEVLPSLPAVATGREKPLWAAPNALAELPADLHACSACREAASDAARAGASLRHGWRSFEHQNHPESPDSLFLGCW